MMLFKPNIPPTQVAGLNLVRGRRSASQRAGVAAQLVLGEVSLTDPTVTQAAALLGVSVPWVSHALSASVAERAALAAGEITIGQLHLVLSWRAASENERIEFARRIGAEELFDDAVAPAITTL